MNKETGRRECLPVLGLLEYKLLFSALHGDGSINDNLSVQLGVDKPCLFGI